MAWDKWTRHEVWEGGGAAAPAPTFSISGTVSGDVVEGVTVTLTGDASDSTTTAVDGTYSFEGLSAGDYTVTPSIAGYNFTPASTNVTIVAADQTGKNFTSAENTYTVSGEIVDGTDTGIEGVTITLTGDASDSTTTDSNGAYSFTLTNGSYVVTPTKSGYEFVDASEAVEVADGNVVVDDMVGTLVIVQPQFITFDEAADNPYTDTTNWHPAFGNGDGASPETGAPSTYAEYNPLTGGTGGLSAVPGVTGMGAASVKVGSSADNKWIGYGYKGFNAAGQHLDLENGFKVQVMFGAGPTNIYTHYSQIYVYNLASYQAGPAGTVDGLRAYFKGHSTAYISNYERVDDVDTDHTYSFSIPSWTGTSAACWWAHGIQVPPNATGTMSNRIRVFKDGGWGGIYTKDHTLTGLLSGYTLDAVSWVGFWWNSTYGHKPQIAYIWVGAYDDDWPI